MYNINTYDAYGNTNSSSVTAASRFAYTGQIYLAEIGLYYYKARVYNQKLGRFMQADPIGYAAGMNMYGYVSGDPVNYTDPLGLCGTGEGDRHCIEEVIVIGHSDGSQSCRGCMFGAAARQFVSDYQSGFGQGAQEVSVEFDSLNGNRKISPCFLPLREESRISGPVNTIAIPILLMLRKQ